MKRIIALLVVSALLCGCTKTPEVTTASTTAETAPITTAQPFGEELEPMFCNDTEFKNDTPSFTPITKTCDVKYGNLPCNLSGFKQTGFICPDTENNILYFTDLGKTNNICQKEDGKITELVHKSGSYLNLWNGWLYYICDSETPINSDTLSAKSGDIWRYNISTGENELFFETDAYTLMISDYGVDFAAGYPRTIEYEGAEATVYETALYRVDFNGENLCKIMEGGEAFVYYGESILVNNNGYKSFYNTKNNTYTSILPRSGVSSVSQNGDWLTYIGGNTSTSIHAVNVRTGEMRFFEDKKHFQYIYGYVWIGEILYAAVDNGFVKITADSSEYIEVELEEITKSATAVSVMTDGINLYGVTFDYRLYRYDYDDIIGMYKAEKMEILSYEEN